MTELEPDWMRYGEPIRLDNPTDSRAIVLGMVPDGVDVLELGCSVGYMTRVMHERGSRIVGVEIDPEAARHAEPYLDRLIVGDLDVEPLVDDLPAASFDLVLAADVLEHLRDPAACLRSLIRLLRPTGSIIISVPNVAHVDVRLELLDGRFRYRENGLLDRTHVKMYTLEELSDLLATVDLVPTRWRPNRRPLATTEIAVDDRARAFGELIVEADPEADVYQWIVVCRPAAAGVDPAAPDIGPNRVGSTLADLTRRDQP
ncbi:MAG: Ubiquinone biosynthesis O-methyltransferase, partial [Actinomycetota bacterium]